MALCEGMRVRLHSLEKRSDLNGRIGIIQSLCATPAPPQQTMGKLLPISPAQPPRQGGGETTRRGRDTCAPR